MKTFKISLRDGRYMTFTSSLKYGANFLAGLDEVDACLLVGNEIIPKRDIISVVVLDNK